MKNKHNWHPQILVKAATVKATAALAGALGKRDLECTGQLTDEEVAEIARELEERCLSLDFDSEVGLTKDSVDATFDASDGQYNSLTHSLIHAVNLSLTQSLTHSLTHSLTDQPTHSHRHSLIYSLTRTFTKPFLCSFTH